MNHTYNNVHLLLAIIISCVSITLFHVHGITAENNETEQAVVTRPIESLNAEDALDYVMPLLISGHIKGAAELLTHSNPAIRNQLLSLIIEQHKASLSSYHKLQLLIAAAHTYGLDLATQHSIFNIIERYKNVLPYPYTLLYATEHDYQNILDSLISWIKQKGPGSFASLLFDEGLKTIINENSVHALDTLLHHHVSLTPKKANELLYDVILKQKSPQFIPLLVKSGADIHAADSASYTLLMHAVALNNLPLTKELLEEGANPNLIISPEVGSALQLAIEKHFVNVELLLRQYGGRE